MTSGDAFEICRARLQASPDIKSKAKGDHDREPVKLPLTLLMDATRWTTS